MIYAAVNANSFWFATLCAVFFVFLDTLLVVHCSCHQYTSNNKSVIFFITRLNIEGTRNT